MAGSPVRIPLARRLATLLAMAAIATALGGVAPAAAGGKPMPAGGKPMPLTSGQRSVAAADRQVADALAANPGSRRISPTSVQLAPGVVMTVAAADTGCASGWLCMWQHVYRAGAKLAFYYCNTQNLGSYYISPGNSWRDDISSIWNHQTGGVVSYFYDWKGLGYVRVGSLSAGNYLQDLTRDRAADGGNWNDRIDQVSVC
jgi:hypothetical protein